MSSTVFDSFYFKDRYATRPMRALWDDRASLQRWLDVEAALAEVEGELGLIPRRAAREISRKAKLQLLDPKELKAAFDRTWNPVVPLVDALRAAVGPEAARYVHWGATSKNVFDTGMTLQVREAQALLLADLDRIGHQLAALAERHRLTVMAGRTHGQQALPVTFGFKAAAWLDELLRQRERLLQSRKRVLVGEWGGAVGTLSSLGRKGLLVQKRLLERLGLGAPTIPVKTAGDRLAEFALLLCMISATLGKIAQNIYNLQQSEIDEVTEFTEGKVGSSAMPHKQNPVASGSVVLLGRLARANAGPALDYIHCEGEDDHRQGETAWKFLPEVCLLVSAQLSILNRVLARLVVKPDNMRRNLDRGGGLATSESLMMALAARLGQSQAHRLVGELAREAARRGLPLGDVAAQNPEVSRLLSKPELERRLDYRQSIGLAPFFVDRVLALYRRTYGKNPRPAR
jgi:adenylosuccinate lyase